MTPPFPLPPDAAPTVPRPAQRWLMLAFFGVALVYHGMSVSIGWDRPIADFNPWRQSQTALGAQAILDSGFTLAAPIPVLGPPWSIPFEFPTYQALVALLTRTSGLSLESSGRIVSLAAFYLALAAAAVLLRSRLGLRSERFFLLGLALIAPTYLSWSRAFSIESTALALSAWYLVALDRWLTKPGLVAGAALAAAGCLAGPTKATTFAVFLVATLPLVYTHGRTQSTPALSAWRPAAWTALLAYLLPLAATVGWTRYTDAVKAANPLTAMLTSDGLQRWNFGTWDQRVSLETWRHFELLASNVLAGREFLLVALLCVTLFSRYRWVIAALATLFLIPPLVFTNLYFAHDYYWYANGLFAVFALGLALLPVISDPRVPLAAGVVIAALGFYAYRNTFASWYLPKQQTVLSPALDLAAAIKREVPPGSYCIVQGFDWDPTLAYHSGRRMIMETARHHGLRLDEEPLRSAIAAAGPDQLGGLVMVGEARLKPEFVAEQLRLAGLSPQPVYADAFGTLYTRNSVGTTP